MPGEAVSSIRLLIVEGITSAIQNVVSASVYRNLDLALEAQRLPSVVVTSGDDMPNGDFPTGMLEQAADVEIQVLVAQSENPESAADEIEIAVHKALMGYLTANPSGPVIELKRNTCSWAFDLGDCASRTLRYQFLYRTSHADIAN